MRKHIPVKGKRPSCQGGSMLPTKNTQLKKKTQKKKTQNYYCYSVLLLLLLLLL